MIELCEEIEAMIECYEENEAMFEFYFKITTTVVNNIRKSYKKNQFFFYNLFKDTASYRMYMYHLMNSLITFLSL